MYIRILAAAAALAISGAAHAQMFAYDAESIPSVLDVHFGAWQVYGGESARTTTYAHSTSHSLDVTSGFATPWIKSDVADGVKYVAVDFFAMAPEGSAGAKVAFDVGAQPINANTEWTANTFVVRTNPYAFGTRFAMSGAGVYVDDVSMRQVTRAEAATIQDANFAALMPTPFSSAAAADRFALIPNAAARLASGQTLKTLMVGDSIVNDTFNSYFDSLVDRRYDGAQLQVASKVIGGAGAAYWSQGSRIADALVSNPDLLMFGGVSTSQVDVPLIHDVIAKARAVNPAIEIVLMARMAGDRNQTDNNPFLNPALAQPVDPNGTDYRADLYRLAVAENVQFWDLTAAWSQYLLASGLPVEDFYRDQIHMGGRGNMVAGRVMESFFSPLPPADFSGDGEVNGDDLALWQTNFGKEVAATRGEGDADGDHDVDGEDFLLWQRHLTLEDVATAIPEPGSLALAAGGGLLLGSADLRRRRPSV